MLLPTWVQQGAAAALFPRAIWLPAQLTSAASCPSLAPRLVARPGSAADKSHRSPEYQN